MSRRSSTRCRSPCRALPIPDHFPFQAPTGGFGSQRSLAPLRRNSRLWNGGNAAPDFVFEPHAPITLLEGWNGAGKTSLINLIVWCLTGQILRPQRPPESGQTSLTAASRAIQLGRGATSHALSPITPLPNPDHYVPPPNKPIPADSWVELTFVDQDGNALPPIRRTQVSKSNGKLSESNEISRFGCRSDRVAYRNHDAALLPFLQVGATRFGLAVAS